MGIKALFDIASIDEQMQRFARENEDRFINGLMYIGEEFINIARDLDTYKDQTGNLRSSIGYRIFKDGKMVGERIMTAKNNDENGSGVANAKSMVDEISKQYKKGIFLFVVAGMNYALYVEAKGFDVLSGSRPSRADIVSMFKDLLK